MGLAVLTRSRTGQSGVTCLLFFYCVGTGRIWEEPKLRFWAVVNVAFQHWRCFGW